MKGKQKSFSIRLIWILIIIAVIISIVLRKEKTDVTEYSSELLLSQSYDEVQSDDEYIYSEDDSVIDGITFDAYFLKDTNSDGKLESVRGTCNEIGESSTLYMNLGVEDGATLTNGKITINSNNFYLKTTIIEDNEIAQNCISQNADEIYLNDITGETNKTIVGLVCSGDYSSTSTVIAAIGNDTNKYSMGNSITFSGTYVNSNGEKTYFKKEIEFTVDWYGEVNIGVKENTQTIDTPDISTLMGEDGITLEFTLTTTETLNKLILAGNYISGTIPELNGYMPTSVKISGTNVTYTYDEETGNFTACMEAGLDESKVVTTNAYTSQNGNTRYNKYTFKIVYPEEAYTESTEELTSIELQIPIEAYNLGYNNPSEEDGFLNPYVSDTLDDTISVTWGTGSSSDENEDEDSEETEEGTFTIYKYANDGTEEIPIDGTKFVITDLDGNYVTDLNGETVGIWDDTAQTYVVTTKSNGKVVANLENGLYKAVEVYTPDQYVLEENEEDRTYYFGIGTSQEEVVSNWYKTIQGNGWDYIESLTEADDNGVVVAGSISEYETDNGVDVDLDGEKEETSNGLSDGIIVKYDKQGNYLWSRLIGGNDEDELTKIITSSDGGFIAVGYTSSTTVYYNGVESTSLSSSTLSTAGKDGIIIKIDKDGNFEWGVRIGGTLDDEITSVVEIQNSDTENGSIAIVGKYYSGTLNFYDTNLELKNTLTSFGKMDGFVSLYSSTGEFKWCQNIGGEYDDEAVDIAESENGIVVAANYIASSTTSTTNATFSPVYLDKNKENYQVGTNTSVTNGLIVGYELSGNYSWRYRLYPSAASNVEISSIDADSNGENIVVAVEHSYALRGSLNNGTAKKITTTSPTNKAYDASIIELTSAGEYANNIYNIEGNYDDYISNISYTSDGGILFGGWYYSTDGIDINKDGVSDGVQEENATSNSFVIKLDSEGNLAYSNVFYGDNYDSVTSAIELENGAIVAGGNTNSSKLYALTYSDSSDYNILTQDGNTDGFIVSQGDGLEGIEELTTLSVENEIRTYTISTKISNYESDTYFEGGIITGTTGTYNGVEYTTKGVRYVESVQYGKTSTKEIKITAYEGYLVSSITINGEQYQTYTQSEDSSGNTIITLPVFENVTQDIEIVVEFEEGIASVEVNHYLWTESDGISTVKVANSQTFTGEIEENYEVLPLTDIEYEIITVGEYYSGWTNSKYYGDSLPDGLNANDEYEPENADDYYIPSNSVGIYGETEDDLNVVNYYYKVKTYTVTVYHYLAGTETEVPQKGASEEETSLTEYYDNYTKGSSYTTSQASEDSINYELYELTETPENATGTISENTVVVYYYQVKTVDISITKVAEEDHLSFLSGAEFNLYYLVGESDDTLIDVESEDLTETWQLFGTYESSSSGVIKLEDLPINYEYRLVEITAPER